MPHVAGLSTWLMLALIILVWPVFFAALWYAIVFSISLVSGWRRLSKYYRAAGPPAGGRLIGRASGVVGFASYNQVMKITITDNGLFLALPWIFRLAHPPLFIPWRDIRNAHRVQKFRWRYVAFDVGDPKVVGIRLASEVFDGTPVFID